MTNALAKTSPNQSIAGFYNPDSQIALIRQHIAKTANEDEFQFFISISKHLGLDPFRQEIYLVPRYDSGLKKTIQVPQVGVAGLRTLADRTDAYAPGAATTYQYDASDRLVSATAHVKKFAGGAWHDVSETVFFDEFVQRTKEGNITKMWAEKPCYMLGKCAEAAAIRRAHPASVPPGLAVEGDTEPQPEDARTDNTKGAIAAEQMTKPPAAKVLSYISSAHDVDKLHEINARIEAYEWSAADSKSFKDAFTKRYDQLTAKELEAEVAQ